MSDSEGNDGEKSANKRRKRKEKKENIIKNKKVKGLEHINHMNKHVPARKTGPDCGCKRYKCYTKVNTTQRESTLLNFNAIGTKNEQDAYLMGLMSASPAARHTVNNPQRFRMSSFKYKIRTGLDETNVCLTAFCNIHGVTVGRIRRLQDLMAANVPSPRDKRGIHTENRARKTPECILSLIRCHISSFPARQSHYSRRDNPNTFYLPEELTVTEMHNMFLNMYRINVSFIVYWSVFKKEFNIKFGLPRTDTCAVCDSYKLKIKSAALPETVRLLETEHKLHLAKAAKFHEIKKQQKLKAQQGQCMCLSFDFMQNLPLPHIRTGDVFYARQLWNFVFGIHDLGTNNVCMNSYLETEGKKGQNDVTSLLLKYFIEHDTNNEHLVLFSDGCPGQNKNYVMVYFLYALVHILRLFKSVKYIFPIRGHSYLPNDQDFSLIGNLKKIRTVETADEWDAIIGSARKHPSAFEVKRIRHDMFYDIKKFLEPYFLKQSKPAMKIKNVRMLKIEKEFPHFVFVKYNFTGGWTTIKVRNKKALPTEATFVPLYKQKLQLNPNKVADLNRLKKFLSDPSKMSFYDSILNSVEGSITEEESATCGEIEIDNEDNSSGEE